MDLNSPELMRIFCDESGERAARLAAGARSLRDGATDEAAMLDLARDAHTIKGSAGFLRLTEIRDLASGLEQSWKALAGGGVDASDIAGDLESSADLLVAALDELVGAGASRR